MDKWTGKEYSERAIKFRKDTGADSFPVISKEKHPQQWREWYAWYGYRRMEASQELMREKDEKTVPALSPYEFDASFSLSKPAPDVPREAPRSTRTPPIFISQEKARDRHRHLPILHTDISFDQFKAMSKARSIPVGAVWVAALGIIYGPEPKSA